MVAAVDAQVKFDLIISVVVLIIYLKCCTF